MMTGRAGGRVAAITSDLVERRAGDRVAPRHADAERLQRAVGNRAISGLFGDRRTVLRSTGWSGTSGPNSAPTTAGAVKRIPIEDPSLPGNKQDDLVAGVSAKDRAVILVPDSIDGTKPVQALLHLHGQNIGLRGASPRDLRADLDRMEEQLTVAIGRGDKQIVGVLAQGTRGSDFGGLKASPDGYVKACLAVLKRDGGIDIAKLAGVIASGHSAGGNTIAEIAKRESSRSAPQMQAVLLFEGINNFQNKKQVPNPRKPGETMTIRVFPMAGRDKLDSFVTMAARRLRFDVDQLKGQSMSEQATHLSASFTFRAYFGVGGLYDPVHRLLDIALRTLFGEPVTTTELAMVTSALPGAGLNLGAVSEAANLSSDIGALPAAVRGPLRDHYRVIPVEQLADTRVHKAKLNDATGAMHSLGHDNIVGSGAFLDALGATRSQRGALSKPVPVPSPHAVLDQLLNNLPQELLPDDLRRQLLALADGFAPAPIADRSDVVAFVDPSVRPAPPVSDQEDPIGVRRARARAATLGTSAASGRPTLRVGSQGDAVVELQHLVNNAVGPASPLEADGRFGAKTAATVAAFQRAAGLAVDQVVGPLTWSALDHGGAERDEASSHKVDTDTAGAEPSSGPLRSSVVGSVTLPALAPVSSLTPATASGGLTPTDRVIATAEALGRLDGQGPAAEGSRLRRADIANALANRVANPKLAGVFATLDRAVTSLPDEPSRLVACMLMGKAVVRMLEVQFILDPSKSALDLLPPDRAAHYKTLKWSRDDYPGGPAGRNESEATNMAAELGIVRPERRANQGATAVLTQAAATKEVMGKVRRNLAEVPGQNGHHLHKEAAASFELMATEARLDGVSLRVLSSFREPSAAAANAKKSGNSAAVAAFSSHSLGLAIDLQMSAGAQKFAEMTTTPMKNVVDMRSAPAHKWMLLRGDQFGWFPYTNEPWHWEYNPAGFKDRFLDASGVSAP